MNVLNEILIKLDTAKDQGQKVSIVFDLDSTLFCVSPRSQQIMRDFVDSEFAKPFRDSHNEALQILKAIEALPSDWGIRTALIRAGVTARLDFFEAVRGFWSIHFFSNEYLKYDEPYEGAVEFVKECEQKGGDVWYLTGRDWPRMGNGTEEQLKRHGLPYPPGQLSMKTDSEIYDTQYKVDFFNNFQANDLSSTWFIDNEPVILNAVQSEFPDLNVVYAGTVHSGREEPPKSCKGIGFKWKY